MTPGLIEKEYLLRVPSESSRIARIDLFTLAGLYAVFPSRPVNLGESLTVEELESLAGRDWEYTEEELEMFAEEAEWTPELAERYRDFLED